MGYFKRKLANWVINSVLKGFDLAEVFQNLTPEQKEEYAMKSKIYIEDPFWKEFDTMIDQMAINKMGRESTNADEVMFGKMVLWFNFMRRNKIKEFSLYKKTEVREPEKW